MPPTLVAQGAKRREAETEVLALLEQTHNPQPVKDIVEKLHVDEATALRAIFRLVAAGHVHLDQNFVLSLA